VIKRSFFTRLIAFVSVAFATTIVHAQPLPADIQYIISKNVLVVGMTNFDNLPFYGTKDGEVIGLDAEIARKVAAIIGVPVKFRRDAATFQDVVDQVRRGETHIAISKLSITPPRLATVAFSEPYARLHQAVLVNRLWLSSNGDQRELSEVIRDLHGPIGFIRNTAYETFAKLNFPHAPAVPQDTWQQVLDNVMTGKTAVAYRDEFEIKRITIDRPESSITTKAVIITDSTDYIAAVVDPKSTQLLQIVNFVIKNDFNNIDVRKLVAMYKHMSQGTR
jgi:ABC-type amino acid transport substrate-binding protein